MSVYLHDIPLPQARQRFEAALEEAGLLIPGRGAPLGLDEIPLDENALGRVLAAPVWAKISSPHYHASAMDGFALRAADTGGAMPNVPVTLVCGPQAAYLDTGDPLPLWADAVAPVEVVEPLDEAGRPAPDLRRPYAIRLRAALPPWQHVRTLGEDIVASQLVLPAGHTLRPVDLGAVAACGHHTLRVARRPRVGILPTGTELVPVGSPVEAGDIIEYNSLVLAAQIREWGGEAKRYPITADHYEALCERVRQAAAENDLVLINAGSSAGSEDFSARVVETLGTLLVHGVAVRPGHPVILGMLQDIVDPEGGSTRRAVPIVGVPGYPVSAALTGEIFVEPILSAWLGRPALEPQIVSAFLTRKITSPAGDDDYVRLALGRVGGRLLAAPLARGAGVITSLVRADGVTVLPRGSQGAPAGEEVPVRLYRAPAELERTIFAIGSHDLTLDLLAQFLALHRRRLASANVGSQGGLVALRRGEAHLAGSHLLDPESGEYNLPAIRQYLPGVPVKVVALVGRQQGLLVRRGNPLGIRSLEDLARPEVTLVNRQRGAGTRVLLDYHLQQLGIDPAGVKGYAQEEYTHLSLAAAVASGRADAGLGIAAAADALDLEFIPLFDERYDLVIPAETYSSELLAPLFEILSGPDFKRGVSALRGYNVSQMGRLIAELD